MTTRNCSRCAEEKTISGVWYLISSPLAGAFVCEACFRAAPRTSEPAPTPTLGLLSGWTGPGLATGATVTGPRVPR